MKEELINQLQELEKISFAIKKGETLRKQKELKEKEQRDCNHQKGGFCEVKDGRYTGKVHNNKGERVPIFYLGFPVGGYAVIKHQFPWGDIWVRCIRCGKWWKPQDVDYNQALNFPTHNTPSTSIQFDLPPENIAHAREITRGT